MAFTFQVLVSTVTPHPYRKDNMNKTASNEDFPSPEVTVFPQ